MSILRNRHVLIAALVAPVLALIAYFGMDFMFGESPSAAVEGQSYPLAEKPNCRWESGSCGLKNNEFELEIHYRRLGGDRFVLDLEAVYPLEGVMLAAVRDEADEAPPEPMQATGGDGLNWTMEIEIAEPGTQRIRLAASAAGSVYFGDVSTNFMLADRAND
jgi:hypothetical protein